MKKAFFLFALAVLIISCATNGKNIDNYNNPQKALLVMDMQNDALGKDAKMPIANSGEELIKIVNAIIDDYYSKGYKIIYIKTEYSGLAFIKGTPGAKYILS